MYENNEFLPGKLLEASTASGIHGLRRLCYWSRVLTDLKSHLPSLKAFSVSQNALYDGGQVSQYAVFPRNQIAVLPRLRFASRAGNFE